MCTVQIVCCVWCAAALYTYTNPAKIVDQIGMCNMYSMNVVRCFKRRRNSFEFVLNEDEKSLERQKERTKNQHHQCDIVCIRVFYAVAHFIQRVQIGWACTSQTLNAHTETEKNNT